MNKEIEQKLNKIGILRLHPFQEKVLNAFLKKQDILVFVMTGGGKSLCYQLPSLLTDKVTIVISPLKSLMEDQVNELKKLNIKSCIFSGDQLQYEKFEILQDLLSFSNTYKIIFTNPETLEKNLKFLEVLENLYKIDKISMIVFDEAHCISIWGNDFRPSYLKMSKIRDIFKKIPFMALTASATKKVEIEIKKILNLSVNTEIIKESFRRENLNIQIIDARGKNVFIDIENKLKNNLKNKSGIIYCNSRKKCESLQEYLFEKGIKAAYFHAGLDKEKRIDIQNKWKSEEIYVVIATIAFGMGINKKDVRFVIHLNFSSSIENYYQEIGRAGRDGIKSDCFLYYDYKDKIIQKQFIDNSLKENCIDLYNYKITKLNEMILFLENITDCRHYLLTSYFGENKYYSCKECCDNCKSQKKTIKRNILDICKYIFELLGTSNICKVDLKKKLEIKFKGIYTSVFIDRIIIFLISKNILNEEIIIIENSNIFKNIKYQENISSTDLFKKIINCNSIYLKEVKENKITDFFTPLKI